MREWLLKLKESLHNPYGRKFIRTTLTGLCIVLFMLLTVVIGLGHIPDMILIGMEVLYTLMFTGVLMRMLNIGQKEREVLEQQGREIEDLNKSQNRFFSSMSHEIRTPINTIIGMNELILRDKSVSDEIAQDAEAIQGASRMLLALINDILDMSKIESGQMDIVEVTYDIAQLLSEVVGMISNRAAEKGLELKLDIDPGIPSMLCGDELRIKQVLVNILNNAVKYTKEGVVTMSVYSDTIDTNHVRLQFRIEDTGIGIKKEALPYLFDAFKRVDQAENRYIEGTGLGLAIVKQIVTLMHGEIAVDSVYMKGSTFSVSLDQEIIDPKAIGNLNVNTVNRLEQREAYRHGFEAPKARLLIVDDNEFNLKVEARLLKDTQMTIDLARSGAEALQMTLKERYDVIFMDHLMPQMDGIECLKRIREQEGGLNRDASIVALTANAGSDNLALYAASGFDGFLLKPVSGQKLESTLLKLLPQDKVTMTGAATMQSESSSMFSWHNRKRQVLVTMDSGGDLPDELTRRFGIRVINYHVHTDTGVFRDNAELDSDELLHYLEDETHSAYSAVPDAARFERFFATMLTRAQHIIHITIVGGNSRSFANATEAAKSFDNVYVVDSEQISSGTGLLALYAARMAETDMPVDALLKEIDAVKRQIRTSFIVDKTTFLRKGGRVSPFVDALSRSLLLHPVIVLKDDRMQSGAIFSGDYHLYRDKYIRWALRNRRRIDPSVLFFTYAGLKEDEITQIMEKVDSIMHFDRVIIQKAASATTVNCGPGTFGLIYRVYGEEARWKEKLFDFLPIA